MPRLFLALQMESRTPIVDILEQTPALPDGCQWALFLRNHDELTLEMVTDEERDYMYRRYAGDPRMRVNVGIRRRLATLLQDDGARWSCSTRCCCRCRALRRSTTATRSAWATTSTRRPRLGAHADAVERREERRLLPGRSARLFLPSHHRLAAPLGVDQRRRPAPQPVVVVVVDAADDRDAPAQPGLRPRRHDHHRERQHKVLTFLRSLADQDDVLVVANLSRHAPAGADPARQLPRREPGRAQRWRCARPDRRGRLPAHPRAPRRVLVAAHPTGP